MNAGRTRDIEEALGVLWSFREAGVSEPARVRESICSGVSPDIIDELVKGGFAAAASDGSLTLTARGDELGRDIKRRHRLTERLLADVLDIHGAEIDRTACELEHIIAREVTDSICTLLGHPRQCPHGSPIPEGECCTAAQSRFEPIVVSLDRLAPGAHGRIAYVQTKDHGHLHRLLALGVVPGTEIVLHQKAPSFVISAGQTQVALDEETARRVFVRRD